MINSGRLISPCSKLFNSVAASKVLDLGLQYSSIFSNRKLGFLRFASLGFKLLMCFLPIKPVHSLR